MLIGLVVVQRHASGDVSNHGEAYTTNGFLDVAVRNAMDFEDRRVDEGAASLQSLAALLLGEGI